MSDRMELEDLVGYLVRTTRLSRSEAMRVVDDVIAYLGDLPEEFVCRRHRQLQLQGHANPEIFARLKAELATLRFRAPAFSERQIRRMIYG